MLYLTGKNMDLIKRVSVTTTNYLCYRENSKEPNRNFHYNPKVPKTVQVRNKISPDGAVAKVSFKGISV